MGIIIILALMGLLTFILLVFTVVKKEALLGLTTGVMLVITLVTWFASSYTEVQTGHGGVVKTFGKIELENTTLTEGLNWIKPWQDVDQMSHQMISFDRNKSKGTAAIIQAKDKIPMEADISFHTILNYSAMPYIRQNFGVEYWDGLLFQSAASAIRTAAGTFEKWEELQVDKRVDFQNKITELYATTVKAKMKAKGIPDSIIDSAFEFPVVDLRKVIPIDIELTREIALTKTAEQKTIRKATEIKNAALDAQKRGQDGTAIRDTILRVLFKADKEGFLPEDATMPIDASLYDISQFMLSIAAIKKADAVELAAEKGNLNVMVTGGAIPALPTPVIK